MTNSLPDGLSVRAVPFRNAADGDLLALHTIEVEVERERRPDRTPQTVESYTGFARTLPAYFTERTWLVETSAGEPAAQGACWYRDGDDARSMQCEILVRPRWRRQGVGTYLLTLACDTAEAWSRTVLIAGTHSTAPPGEAFARAFRARVGRVSRTSELVLSALDWEMVERWAAEGPERAPGYRLDAVDGAYPPSLYEDAVTLHRIMQTAPRDDLEVGDSEMTIDEVADAERWLLDGGRGRWTMFVRGPQAACVGGTQVTFEPWEPETVLQGDTGIHPDHRGRGLGKWVKAAMLLRIRDEKPEARRVRTGNAFSNAPMLAINDALGFTVIQSRTEWQLDIERLRAALVSRSSATR